MKHKIPKEVLEIAKTLKSQKYEAYLVGGCVRDLLFGREPKDWDIATSARPEEVQKIFSRAEGETPTDSVGAGTVYENEFGTVGVKTRSEDPKLKVVEVTTFRLEGRYTDKRHPDEIKFAKTIEEDLSRRDFTVNALAMSIEGEIRDPFSGQDDLKEGIIRTVGKPEERFAEDALRLLRAARFATELDFQIDMPTRRAIEKEAGLLEMIAKERIRDEFQKMLMSSRAAAGIILLEEVNLLHYVLPELREGIGVGQNKHHIYTVFEHNVRSLEYAAKKNYSFEVRLASLLHDVGKPKVKRGEGPDCTFYNHDSVGAKITLGALERLRFSKEVIETVAHFVRYHMFYYNVGEVTAAGVRRFLARVGPEYVDDLLKIREADRIGSGVPKAVPYKLRHLLFMIEKVKHDPLSPKMLALRGEDVMRVAAIPPGPKIGQILSILLEEVLENPERNTKEKLESRVGELASFSEKDLDVLAQKANETKEEFESGAEEEMKKKYYVK
ncbi:MAG: CCA tRNA nucleotidyltransferase [Patescibacteria group bacterium]